MDQAQSLRELMRANSGKIVSRAHAGQVFSVLGARPGDGASFVAQALARASSIAGARTLLVREFQARSDSMYRTDAGYYAASARFVREEMHGGEWDDFGFRAIVFDAGAELDEERLAFHDAAYRSVLVLTPTEASFFQAYKHVKLLAGRAGVKKVDIVVNRARDEREGLQIFGRFQEVANRFLSVDFAYAGAVREGGGVSSGNEKSSADATERLTEPKFLIDWKAGHVPVSDLVPIAKKLGLSAQ